VARRHTRL
jgi:FHS family L-fucose permease-like MFS transporter